MVSQNTGMHRPDPSQTTQTGGTGMTQPSMGSPATGRYDTDASSGTGSATDVVDQVKETASNLVDQAKEQAAPRIDSQKDRVVDRLNGTAHALRRTSQTLREQEDEGVARYAEQVAERAERLATYVRERDLGEIVEEVEDFARRQPVLFLGGSFALGLLATRFLRSTRRRESSSSTESGRRREAPRFDRVPSAGFPPVLPSTVAGDLPDFSAPPSQYGQLPVPDTRSHESSRAAGQGYGTAGIPEGYPTAPATPTTGTGYGAPPTPSPYGAGSSASPGAGTPGNPASGYGTGYPAGRTPGMEQR